MIPIGIFGGVNSPWPRVHNVISALLSGDEEQLQINPHDIEYMDDLGLIEVSRSTGIRISNRIYQEVIPRELTWATQVTITNQEQAWYVKPDRSLDMPKLIAAFQQFLESTATAGLKALAIKKPAHNC